MSCCLFKNKKSKPSEQVEIEVALIKDKINEALASAKVASFAVDAYIRANKDEYHRKYRNS